MFVGLVLRGGIGEPEQHYQVLNVTLPAVEQSLPTFPSATLIKLYAAHRSSLVNHVAFVILVSVS